MVGDIQWSDEVVEEGYTPYCNLSKRRQKGAKRGLILRFSR
jgi:hypothetical protein